MTCRLYSKEKIDQLTETVRRQELSIPREIHAFYRKHVMVSAIIGECYAEYYQPYHGTLLLRLFCLSADRSNEKRRIEGNITEYGRRILGGNFILTNFQSAPLSGCRVFHGTGNAVENDSGWCSEDNVIVGKKSSVWCLRPFCEGINLRKTIQKYAPYCAYEQYMGQLSFFDYLEKYFKYPGIEMLVKMGYSNYVSCINILNMKGKNFEQVFKVSNKWKEYLKSKGVGRTELLFIRRYPWIKDETDLKRVMLILDSYTKDGKSKYYDIGWVFSNDEWNHVLKNYDGSSISLYTDYLKFAKQLGYPLEQEKWHYPKQNELRKMHDKAAEEYKVIKNETIDKYIALYSKKAEKFIFSESGLLIRPVQSTDELIKESEVLHHCVRTYNEKVASGQTMIFFIRKSDNPDVPFVTLEMNVENKKIIQIRADHNNEPPSEVKNFVRDWSREYSLKSN